MTFAITVAFFLIGPVVLFWPPFVLRLRVAGKCACVGLAAVHDCITSWRFGPHRWAFISGHGSFSMRWRPVSICMLACGWTHVFVRCVRGTRLNLGP